MGDITRNIVGMYTNENSQYRLWIIIGGGSAQGSPSKNFFS